jgi:hypothetical protein
VSTSDNDFHNYEGAARSWIQASAKEESAVMVKRPKFKVGQVVRNGASLFQITEASFDSEAGSWKYRDIWSWYFESGLRPLTRREKGQLSSEREGK